MNLVINSSCNKKCSFCFAGEKPPEEDTGLMSLEYASHIVSKMDHEENEPVKIIGGEPTLHPDFSEILKMIDTKNHPATLVSNFLTSNPKVWNSINEFLENNEMGFLVNVSELNEKQFERVSTNINALNNSSFNLSYTLDIKRSFKDYEYWLEKFYSSIGDKFSVIRTSLPFPDSDTNKKGFYLYKNYEYVDLLIDFIKWGMIKGIKTTIDCGIFPCMLKDEKTKIFIENWIENLNYGCSSGAYDIFNNGDVVLCYPGKNIKTKEEKHKTLNTAYKEILFKKTFKTYTLDNLPEECKNCEFLGACCDGPCAGFLTI